MRSASVSPRSASVLAVSVSVLVAFPGCSSPLRLQIPAESHVAAAPAPGDGFAPQNDSITVQVRYFSYAPGVSVLAWRTKDADYGLRARIRNDGSLIRDPVIYVSTSYHPAFPRSPRARIPSRRLESSNGFRDDNACRFGECSPFVTWGALIPDDVLRAATERVPVTFYEDLADRRGHPLLAPPESQGGLREMTVTLDPELITAFLTAVDSVSAELRRRR